MAYRTGPRNTEQRRQEIARCSIATDELYACDPKDTSLDNIAQSTYRQMMPKVRHSQDPVVNRVERGIARGRAGQVVSRVGFHRAALNAGRF